MVGYLWLFVTAFSYERVWSYYSSLTSAKLLFTLSNSDEVTEKNVLSLYNGSYVTEKIIFASVTVKK